MRFGDFLFGLSTEFGEIGVVKLAVAFGVRQAADEIGDASGFRGYALAIKAEEKPHRVSGRFGPQGFPGFGIQGIRIGTGDAKAEKYGLGVRRG